MNLDPKTSEKNIEHTLCKKVSAMGGVALKFASQTQIGYPDRIVILPGGRVLFVEIKSKGKHPRKVQAIHIAQLRNLGVEVHVIDHVSQIDNIL